MRKLQLYPITPNVLRKPIAASEIPAWDSEADLFIRVNLQTYGLLMLLGDYVAQERFFTGVQADIDTAVAAMVWQSSQEILTSDDICDDEPEPWGAAFRIRRDEGGAGIFEVMQGEGLPVPPWEFRMTAIEGGHLVEYRSLGSDEPFQFGGTMKAW